ncbi:MAG: type 2 isopentenyl-diphosphate Delta-isomerase [Deltaproteobacteria bacterium]|nr:type 2 isopentenyl-diphosphate Delta-isomerase [Deltaproteobacteria bacterium]
MVKKRAEIAHQKNEHLDLCSTDSVAFRQRTTLLEDVQLLHQSLPELSLDEIDLSVELLGKRLKAPLVIAAMTGGTRKALEINTELAALAESNGYGFGLGSQRAMLDSPKMAYTFRVRQRAPNVLLLGNIGVVQARDCATPVLEKLVHEVEADALCVHMNPAMEVIQRQGDRNFTRCIETFARLVRELSIPVVAKETGAGVSTEVARRLSEIGVTTIDVSGAGGTSWVGVEALRAQGEERELGELLWDWGIPTAASIVYASRCSMNVIATGGIHNGLDVARSIALGATAAGIARPILQAFQKGGRTYAEDFLRRIKRELAVVMLLCGVRTIAELKRVPKVILGELRHWLNV